MLRYIIFFIIIFIFFGCKQQIEKQNIMIDISNIDTQKPIKKIKLRQYSGPYSNPIIDKKLGEGLLNKYYNKIKIILDNHLKTNENINIKFKLLKENNISKKILKEATQYFNEQSNYVVTNAIAPDIIIDINYDPKTDIVLFKINRPLNLQKFIDFSPKVVKVEETIKYFLYLSKGLWSKIKLTTNDGQIMIFEIMKRPVLESEYSDKFNKIPTAQRNVTFDEADSYCYKKYKGSIASLYVFEIALRRGLIEYATKYGANKEMVARFDEANEEDMKLKMPGDIVRVADDKCEKLSKKERDKCYADLDYFIQLIFDYNDFTYKRLKTIDEEMNEITFRCIKRIK